MFVGVCAHEHSCLQRPGGGSRVPATPALLRSEPSLQPPSTTHLEGTLYTIVWGVVENRDTGRIKLYPWIDLDSRRVFNSNEDFSSVFGL